MIVDRIFLPPRDTSVLLLLVAVNLLLLSFFALLNALSVGPTGEVANGKIAPLGKESGYDVAAAQPLETGGTAPQVPTAAWVQSTAAQLQGVVVNRFNLRTLPLQTDADRITLTLPIDTLFAKEELANPELIRALMLAARDAQLSWQLQGTEPTVIGQGAALTEVTGKVRLSAGKPQLKLVVKPTALTNPDVGTGVQNLTEQKGGEVKGEGKP